MAARTPHFDLPFRYVGGVVAVVEQGSEKDVVNCVTAIVGTIRGQRIEDPTFGITDPTFTKQPLNLGPITDSVIEQEPRAITLMDQMVDLLISSQADVTIAVSRKEQPDG